MINRLLIIAGLLSCNFLCSQQLIIDSIPYQDEHRKLRLLLPENYKNQKHPLLIMLDAQNLFNDSISYAGEWQVDESVAKLSSEKSPVVIAIDHGNAQRINELTPFKNEKYGGGEAGPFLEWIMNSVIPYAIKTYQLDVSDDWAIAGSSLGGLFSHYAAIQYPNQFKSAGIMSPSYWYSDKIYDITSKSDFKQPQRFWVSGGTAEDENLVQEIKDMEKLLSSHRNVEVNVTIIEGGQHNEAQWRQLFPDFLHWWLQAKKD